MKYDAETGQWKEEKGVNDEIDDILNLNPLEEFAKKKLRERPSEEVPIIRGSNTFQECKIIECPMIADNKCEIKKISKCSCKTPFTSKFFPKYPNFGACDHCGHIVMFKDKKFFHYARSYRCGFPYTTEKCEAPSSKSIATIEVASKP